MVLPMVVVVFKIPGKGERKYLRASRKAMCAAAFYSHPRKSMAVINGGIVCHNSVLLF